MAFAGDGTYYGLSGQRPLVGIGSGTRFIDRGTGDESYFDGSIWKQSPRNIVSGSLITGIISGSATFAGNVSFSGVTNVPGLVPRHPGYFTIFKSGNTTISQKFDGTILAALSGAPGAVIQASLNEISGLRNSSVIMHSDIYVCDGDYDLESGFNGISFPPFSVARLTMGRRAVLQVPIGYSGYVFRFPPDSNYITLEGGYIREATNFNTVPPPEYRWQAFRFDTVGVGDIVYCAVRDIDVSRAEVGLHFVGSSGFMTSNTFDNIRMDYCKYYMKWDLSGYAFPNFANNVFRNIICQDGGPTLIGADRIPGKRNEFNSVVFWDSQTGASGGGAINTVIASGSEDNIIIGGIMTNRGTITSGDNSGRNRLEDYGSGTQILDSFDYFYTPSARVGTCTNRNIEISGQGSPTIEIKNSASGANTHLYIEPASGRTAAVSMWEGPANRNRLELQQTVGAVFIDTVRQFTSGQSCPMIFRVNDAATPVVIEPMRLDISGNVVFNTSGGTIQFFSGNTSLTKTDTPTMSGFFAPLGYITAKVGSGTAVKIPYFAT